MRLRILKMVAVATVAVTAMALPAVAAAAATQPSSHGTTSGAIHIPAPPRVRPDVPSGCDLYHYCTYNQSNGGDLCEQLGGTGNLNSACANKNDSGYNHRTVYSVNLYWGSGETGAYYNLGPGHYLLYMTQNNYNQCNGGGHSCNGYGQEIGYNLASVKFN
jgi:hypothetical protein